VLFFWGNYTSCAREVPFHTTLGVVKILFCGLKKK
jgi:hypothetical protein